MASCIKPYQYYLLLACLIPSIILFGCKREGSKVDVQTNVSAPSPAHIWAEISLLAVARDTERYKPRPTVTSRLLALVWISVYDTWTRFDERAKPIYSADVDKVGSKTSKEQAVESAAYHALRIHFAADSVWLDSIWFSRWHEKASLESGTPTRLGWEVAHEVSLARRNDGSNEDGSLSASGIHYDDYTGYLSANTADEMRDPSKWQPKYFIDNHGNKFAPGCLTPFWQLVKPVSLQSASVFRSPPPPDLNSEELKKEVEEVLRLQSSLTNEDKAIVEFMRDGPASVQQAGHWLRFAMDVSKRDQLDLDSDILLFTPVSIAAMDAFVACWDTKMHYDYPRPFALIHQMFPDEEITGWLGIEKGFGSLKGKDWQPYSPASFLCPPFPAYVSGHSTVSAACAEVLKKITGSDEFGITVEWYAGSLTEKIIDSVKVELDFPTFSSTAEQAGYSRVLGGYHIQADNTEGLILGKKVGAHVFSWFEEKSGRTFPERNSGK